jgi:hypothetical protein
MDIIKLGSYFNPNSSDHHAVRDFNQLLKGWQKFLTAAITAISVPLLLGFGSVALFRILTKNFSAKSLNLGECTSELHSSASKTAKSSSSISPSSSQSPSSSSRTSSEETPTISSQSTSSIENDTIPQPSSSKFCVKFERLQNSFIIGKNLEFVKSIVPYLFEGHDPVYQLADGSPIPLEEGDYLVFLSTWDGDLPSPEDRKYNSGLFLPGTLIRELNVGESLQLKRNGQPFTLTLSEDALLQNGMSHQRLIENTEWLKYEENEGIPDEPGRLGKMPTKYPHISIRIKENKAQEALNAQIAQWLSRDEECHTFTLVTTIPEYVTGEDFTWDPNTVVKPANFAFEINKGFTIEIPGAKELALSFKGNHLFAHYKGIGGMTFGCFINLEDIGVTPYELLTKQVDKEQLQAGIFTIYLNLIT